MPRTTFEIPEELHRELSTAVRKHKITIGIATAQALRLWLKQSPETIAQMVGVTAGLSSADRKRVERFVELLNIGEEDIKAAASRRIARFLAVARDEATPRSTLSTCKR